MGICLAASCSFLTPLVPSATLVYRPGYYRFSDFLRVGGPITVLMLVILAIGVPMAWPFRPHQRESESVSRWLRHEQPSGLIHLQNPHSADLELAWDDVGRETPLAPDQLTDLSRIRSGDSEGHPRRCLGGIRGRPSTQVAGTWGRDRNFMRANRQDEIGELLHPTPPEAMSGIRLRSAPVLGDVNKGAAWGVDTAKMIRLAMGNKRHRLSRQVDSRRSGACACGEGHLVGPNNRRKYTLLVVGSGLAGAAAAATLGELGYRVHCFCFQDSPRRAHSVAAQGGINAAKNYRNDSDSVWRLFYDTLKGGDFRSREANVYRLAQLSNQIIDHCVAQGVPFAREYGGSLATRSFGGALVSRTFIQPTEGPPAGRYPHRKWASPKTRPCQVAHSPVDCVSHRRPIRAGLTSTLRAPTFVCEGGNSRSMCVLQ